MSRDCVIVIPTTDRPEMLRAALASVRRQLAIDRVSRVIVSENADGRETAGVCSDFADLPIQYLCQDPPLGGTEHIAQLLAMTSEPYVAFVCDDDWWAPSHLAVALKELDRNRDCSAHLSAYIWSDGEVATRSGTDGQELLWIAAGCPPAQSAWRIEPDAVLALCTLLTPFTWSSTVMRRVGVERVVKALRAQHITILDDRAFFPALARAGTILYEPTVDTYYRVHPGNYTRGMDPELLLRLRGQGSAEFQARAEERGVDVASMVARWHSLLSPLAARQMTRYLLSELGYARSVALGIPQRQASRAVVRYAVRRLRALVEYRLKVALGYWNSDH